MNKKEEVLQANCYRWFHNTFPLWRKMLFHVDNNSWNAVIGARKKALGVKAGVSDFILITFLAVVFIEMKTDEGEQSDEQVDFQRKVNERNHEYVIIRSETEFRQFVTRKINESNEYFALANSKQ